MGTVALNFNEAEVQDPKQLCKKLNDYVKQVNAQLSMQPPRVFITVQFQTAAILVNTQWPVFSPKDITPIAVLIARVKNLNPGQAFATLSTCPWIDWQLTADGTVQVLHGIGFAASTRYELVMEVVGAL